VSASLHDALKTEPADERARASARRTTRPASTTLPFLEPTVKAATRLSTEPQPSAASSPATDPSAAATTSTSSSATPISLRARGRRVARTLTGLFPLTPLGVLVAAGAFAAVRFLAYVELDLVFLVIGYGSLGVALASLLFSVLGAARIAWRLRSARTAPDRRLETARMLPTGLSLPRLLLLPFVRVRWTWEAPEAELELVAKGLMAHEHAALRARGVTDEIARRVVVEDAFGLARIAWTHRQRAALVTLPHAGALKQLPLLVSMAGGDDIPHPMGVADGDRIELRRYAPGDPARFIHWKVFGRTRRLMVRMPERALTRAKRTVSYLVAGPRDEASAAAARVAVESGVLGDEWVFGADGTPGEASDPHEAVMAIVRSAGIGQDGALALVSFVARAERLGPASLVLFVPPVPGPWLARALSVVQRRGSRTRIVVATDGLDASRPQPAWWRFFVSSARRDRTLAKELDVVVHAFATLRCEVVVLDRVSGRRLGEVHRKALEALDGRRAEETSAAVSASSEGHAA
jgi:hypothetical protein